MAGSDREFRTGGRKRVADNLMGIGIAVTMIGIASVVVYGWPWWVTVGVGLPGLAALLTSIYLTFRARNMRVMVGEDGLRCTDLLGRSESVAWDEVRRLELWRRMIPFCGGALDLTWRDLRGREHTRRIASFDPPGDQPVDEEVDDLIDAIEERLDLQREPVGGTGGGTEITARWERPRAAK
jgi:hypothetical protein